MRKKSSPSFCCQGDSVFYFTSIRTKLTICHPLFFCCGLRVVFFFCTGF
jgi:hypothetical protein